MTRRVLVTACAAAALIGLSTGSGRAHKGITSPFTYNDDVYPILRDRCGPCHVTGGIAPMSLLSHADTVPWGASIRSEVLAGRMPPAAVDDAPSRFVDGGGLTPREVDMLLTWVTGGTPVGNPEKRPPSVMPASATDMLAGSSPGGHAWSLGQPDVALPLPAEGVLAAAEREKTVEFILPTGIRDRRGLRAIDLRPGNATMVRAATIGVRSSTPAPAADGVERILALWLPGMDAVPLDAGAAFELPPSAELVVRLFYRKTWEFENKEVRDRSVIGLYFAPTPAATVQALRLDIGGPSSAVPARPAVSHVLTDDVRVLAVYPGAGLNDVRVKAVAVRPDKTRVDLIAFHPRRDWMRRYWFREPIALPRGTTVEVTALVDDSLSLLPVNAPAAAATADPAPPRLTLNVVPGR